MRNSWRAAVILVAALSLPRCDIGDLGLTGIDLGPPTPCLDATEWTVYGLSVTEVLPVGHSRQIAVQPVPSFNVEGCDEAVVSLRWVSTRPDVAGGFEPGVAKRWAWLTAFAPGETLVSAELKLSDGRAVTAELTRDGRVHPVRVGPAPVSPDNRSVLLEGAVDLEPEESTATPSTRAYLVFQVPAAGLLDMTVDWGSVSSEVIAHMCRGEVASPLGCSPLIDGTRSRGNKPVSGSAQTTAGPHTLWITNSGPGAERVRYQVGLIPG